MIGYEVIARCAAAAMRTRSVLAIALLAGVLVATPADAATDSRDLRFTTSDGTSLAATVSGESPLSARPTLVEFSPYGRGTATLDPGRAYNSLLVQIRGTGDSDGSFDALGPKTQKDVAEVLRWACKQPWSDGRLAINGFSASAITIYNSLHRKLPCVRAAVLKSGTFELYRDLIWPGGISNLVPAAAVVTLIGAPSLIQGPDRLIRDPLSAVDVLRGLVESGLTGLAHTTLDEWWKERRFRGDANNLPILMINGFFDVESRGAFEAYKKLKEHGAHLYVIGAHDGAPAGTDAGVGEARLWLDRYVRGEHNGVGRHPRVQLWLSDGDREDLHAGKFVRMNGRDWPLPKTRWRALALDPTSGGGAASANDGTLTLGDPAAAQSQSYPSLPSIPTMTDSPTIGLVGAAGFDALTNALPILTELNLSEPLGLTYSTQPFAGDVVMAGPASLELRLSSTAPETGIWAVISDVFPDGSAHPVAVGRLSTAYPEVIRKRSIVDRRTGAIVQPYARFGRKSPAPPGEERLYRVEFWPIGNRFKAGHRLRLHVVGASGFSMPSLPAVNTVTVGAGTGSRLLVPVVRGRLGSR
jgi:predicted acyl esterase